MTEEQFEGLKLLIEAMISATSGKEPISSPSNIERAFNHARKMLVIQPPNSPDDDL